jgi:hypothetical protein
LIAASLAARRHTHLENACLSRDLSGKTISRTPSGTLFPSPLRETLSRAPGRGIRTYIWGFPAGNWFPGAWESVSRDPFGTLFPGLLRELVSRALGLIVVGFGAFGPGAWD